jgi:hypothetical protein
VRISINRVCKIWKRCLIKFSFRTGPAKIPSTTVASLISSHRSCQHIIDEDLASFLIYGKCKRFPQTKFTLSLFIIRIADKRIACSWASIGIYPPAVAAIASEILRIPGFAFSPTAYKFYPAQNASLQRCGVAVEAPGKITTCTQPHR